MKMKNLVAFAMLALGAVAAPFAGHAAPGDIYEIYPVEGSRLQPTDTLKPNDTLTFVVRLMSRNFNVPNPKGWHLKHLGSPDQEMWDYYNNPLKLGIVVSGRLELADIVSVMQLAAPLEAYTDITCTYKVKPGDLALPVRLALKGSTKYAPIIAGTTDESIDTAYYLENDRFWTIANDDGDVSVLTYCTEERAVQVSGLFPTGTDRRVDYDLTAYGRFYLQGIRFAEPWDSDTTWRSVKEGGTETSNATKIETIGLPTDTGKFYVWSEDETSVKIPEAKGRKVHMKLPPDGATEGDRWVYEISLTAETQYPFPIEGVTKDTATQLVLSPVDHYVYNDAGTLCADYLTVPVACTEPPKPYVSVTVDGARSVTTTPAVGAAYNTAANVTTVQVKLGGTLPDHDVTVTLKPSIPSKPEKDWTDYIGLSAYNEGGAHDGTVTVTFAKSEIDAGNVTKTLYLYALGSDADTVGLDPTKAIRLDAEVDEASRPFYTGTFEYATVFLQRVNPVITQPTYGEDFPDIQGGTTYNFKLKVDDTYKNAAVAAPAAGYVIYAKTGNTGSSEKKIACPVTADGTWHLDSEGALVENDGMLPVFYDKAGDYMTEIRLVAPDGQKSTYTGGTSVGPVKVNVHVSPPKTVEAVVSKSTWDEGSLAPVSFKIGPTEYTETLYAFIKPKTDAMKDLVSGDFVIKDGQATSGLEIMPPNVESDAGILRLLDGKSAEILGTSLQFDIILWKNSTYDESETEYAVEGFSAKALKLTVNNVVPKVTKVERTGGGTVTWKSPSDTPTMNVSVAKGVPQKFSLADMSKNEPGVLDLPTMNMKWKFEEYNEAGLFVLGGEQELTGTPALTKWEHTFKTAGYTLVTVQLMDKDMKEYPGEYGDEYTFKVNVTGDPSVTVAENGLTFNEADSTGRITVRLSQGANDPIEVKVVVTPYEDSADPGRFVLDQTKLIDPAVKNEYKLTFEPGTSTAMENFLTFSDLDGTLGSQQKGFRIALTVLTTTLNPDGKPYNEYYHAEDARIYVVNEKPSVIAPASNGPLADNDKGYIAQIGANESRAITFTIANDVNADVAAGFTVTFICTGGGGTLDGVTYSGPVKITDLSSHTFVPVFSSQGAQQITLRIEDKDTNAGTEVFERTWYYDVQAAKTLRLVPHGPTGGFTTSAQSQRYADYAAKGHVWADVANPSMKKFNLSYNCGTAKSVDIYAYGYKLANPVDDGTLDDSRDVAIDASGNAAAAAPYYTYANADGLDSFFYRWILIQGGGENASVGSISPEHAASTATAQGSVTLPAELGEDGAYDETVVEAVFAYEFLRSDNVGDINSDGIPDVCVTKVWKNSFGGIFDPTTGEVTGNDLTKLHGFNDDEDYLPSTETAQYGALIPALPADWVTLGMPFDAKTEIRGYHDGLNDAFAAVFPDGTKNPNAIEGVKPDRLYLDPDSNPTSTLSKVEFLAWRRYAERNGLDAAKPADWMKWSPERPTDPTAKDTDEDAYPDGYEYFFWYRAHVGYLEGTNLVQLTGRRYNPMHPCEPDRISSEEIAALMDPLVPCDKETANTRDTDNDGLPDMFELELGTNPFDYDTDGDGLPDGYEVYIAKEESDPLKYATNDLDCDADLNVDSDGMAFFSYNTKDTLYWVAPVVCEDGQKGYICSPAGQELKVVETEPGVTNIVASADGVYTAWLYKRGGFAEKREFCRGRTYWCPDTYTNLVVTGEVTREVMDIIHFDVYHEFGFDPRTGWNFPIVWVGHLVNGREFTARDEFLTQAFFYHKGGLGREDLVPTREKPWATLWEQQSTSPESADTDSDGMPDGWELYMMAGPPEQKPEIPSKGADLAPRPQCSPRWMYGPLESFEKIANTLAADPDGDGLDWPHEYSGVESCDKYADCPTITLLQPEWQNKWWPTDPWAEDTDGDGLKDGEEGQKFIYGSATHVSPDFEDTVPGGGLNPLSWDTDCDGLPDPWEDEFAGTPKTTPASSETTVSPEGVTNTLLIAASATWNDDGMDGTVHDSMKDYDKDGLANWQEYMVGAMRCWRYDDTVSPWVQHKIPLTSSDHPSDSTLYEILANWEGAKFNPGFKGFHFSPAVYFSCANNAFEQGNGFGGKVYGHFYMFKDGIYHDLKDMVDDHGNNRYTRNATLVSPGGAMHSYQDHDSSGLIPIYPQKYICCDPTLSDTDFDGLDDYYELFHGLNPILGESTIRWTSAARPARDIIYEAYYKEKQFENPWSAEYNSWLDSGILFLQTRPDKELQVKDGEKNIHDFFQFPWLAGMAASDPDGDNIRNQQEGIFMNLQAAATYLHTDPTPLWMTDYSYEDSLVCRYYQVSEPTWAKQVTLGSFLYNKDHFVGPDGTKYPMSRYPWLEPVFEEGDIVAYKINFDDAFNFWKVRDDMYDYEENEGYDTDHDYLSDFEEAQGKTKTASDPQYHDDPLRRQAMWFGGDADKGFLETTTPDDETTPYTTTGAEVRQNFLYFTVECWAKPDAATMGREELQTLVERAIWVGPANPADENYLRKNFLIGIKGGRWYAKFDTTGTDLNQPVEITDGPEATAEWTHVAATYDGTALRLYVNGICSVLKETRLQPEHGVSAASVDENGEIAPGTHEWADKKGREHLIAVLVGASAASWKGISFDGAWQNRNPAGFSPFPNPLHLLTSHTTKIGDYRNFYRGYIDEVRLWDGARSASDIKRAYETRERYTMKMAIQNRDEVFAAWARGARRTPTAPTALPAQLMNHWSFDHIPGAVEAEDVLPAPAGFSTLKGVTDAMAPWARPDGWTNCWRTAIDESIQSRVYNDLAWVPWINDTVGHMPLLDETTLDSVYWSANYAGAVSAAAAGYSSFAFPRTAEAPSNRRQVIYAEGKGGEGPGDGNPGTPYTTFTRWMTVAGDDALKDAYRFSHRNRLRRGFDLMPFGGAFARRISSAEGGMWDDQGAADAWAQTGGDANNDGLPDWWSQYALENYYEGDPTKPVTWDTTVNYYGISMPAYLAYKRDLAKGLLVDGEYHPEYEDTRDVDADGLPDWWEELYGVQGYAKADADADPDNDALSNYAEYLLGEVYPYAYEGIGNIRLLNPKLMHSVTNQLVTDYFLRYSTEFKDIRNAAGKSVFYLNEYFGEIATDHDFMEDWWENQFAGSYASSRVYDPLDDTDEDGWSNWAECRATLWGGHFDASLIDRWTGSDSSQHIVCYPEPIVGVRATYHGKQKVTGSPLVIRMTTGQTPRTDATFVVPSTLSSQTRYIGPFTADYALHGHLSPGHINGNSIMFERAKVSSDKTYLWNCDYYKENAKDEIGWDGSATWEAAERTHTGSFETYSNELLRWPKIELEGGDLTWELFTQSYESGNFAEIHGNALKLGTVNLTTGEYELDMTKFEGTVGDYVFRVTYTSRIGAEWPQTVYVSDTKEFATGDGASVTGNGRIREGRNTVEAFLDLNGNGAFDEGEPFGSARNVQVGWHKVPEVVIELKDVSPIMPGITVAAAAGGEDAPASAALTKTVKVIRETINGYPAERTLVTKEIVVDDHPYLTELDVSTAAKPDLDWTWLLKDAAKIAAKHEEFATVEKAVYRVDELVTVDGVTFTNTLQSFVKEFPAIRPTATAVSPVGSKDKPTPVYSASPTLAFSVSDAKATGYRLQIRRFGATSPIYDSGISLLPGRGGATVGVAACEVTPPIYANAPVYSGTTTNRAVFADGTNYQWRVALYDAKYNATTDDSDGSSEWSAWANFEMDVCNSNRYPRLPTGYGNATLTVRYYGPNTNDLTGKIVVEAFENADFRGQPLAQLRLTDLADLDSVDDISTPNAVLRGLKPGQVFFRAYVDQNDNGSRDKWESWGYANLVGQGFHALYNPDPLEITVSAADWVVGKKADRVIYIEDCDANKNELPDCLEPELFPEDVSSDVDETESIDWWEWAEADPDDVTEGDVMAYEEVTMKLVTLWDGKDANVLKSYILCNNQPHPFKNSQPTPDTGMMATNYAFMTAWEYGTLTACGVPVPAEELAGLKVYKTPEDVKVALIHAQVREKNGFCADTAVPGGKTNTKPFTAQDKYYVLRYLEQAGRLGEPVPEGYKSFEDYVMNSGNVKLYEKYCLKPNVIDNDHDGIADGFELYVDSKPLDASDRESDWDEDGVPLWREFDLDPDTGLAHATDPRAKDTDGDGITDKDFHDFLLWDAGGDKDGDGLSNYAEYLITRVFKAAQLDPRNPKTDGSCVDYFRKMGELYFGEIFTDHDQVNDVWEGAYEKAANRYAYDPSRDDDGDDWSNWAEAKAGTDPETEADVGIDGYVLAAYPVPCIETFLTCSGAADAAAPVVIKAWSQKTDPNMTGKADAVWHLGNSEEQASVGVNTSQKYVGLKPNGTRSFNLGPGAIQRGSVRIAFKDLSYCVAKLDQYGEIENLSIGDPDDAKWYYMAQDREGVLYTIGGVLAGEQAVGTVDYETGKVTVNFDAEHMNGMMLGDTKSVAEEGDGEEKKTEKEDDSTYDLLNLEQSYVIVTWSSCTTLGSFNRTLYLSDAGSSVSSLSGGYVREGLNTFMAFVDLDGGTDGEWDPGEPFGVVRDVDVGWDGAKLRIDLTRTSAITPRADLLTGEGDRAASVYEATSTMAFTDPLFLAIYGTNDATRTEINAWFSNRVTVVGGIGENQSARVRVVRYGIDDRFCASVGVGSAKDGNEQLVMLDKRFDATTRSFLCEADFLGDGEFDIDWNTLSGLDFHDGFVVNESGTALGTPTTSTTMGSGPRGAGLVVSNMTYLVVLGDGPTYFNGSGDTNTPVCALATMVTRRFEVTRHNPVGENVETIVHNSRPTFRWSIPDEEPWAKAFGSSYTAFKLQILKEDGKTVVYDSGVRRAPAQDKNGFFTWTAGAYAGDQTALGQLFGAAGNWKWRVAMYNAKFKPTAKDSREKWSALVPFSTSVATQQETDDNGYSSIDVTAKYTGPEAVLADCEDLTKTNGTVRIQAFTTADFSGEPVAQGFVTNKTALTDVTDITANGRLIGLPFGTYYVRAYIDSNGNFKKDDWESWGAAKDAVIVKPNQLAPITGLYIEDADTDQDWIPDAYEYLHPDKYEIGRSDASVDPEGQIILKKEIYDGIVDGTANISRFLPGATLTLFENFEAAGLLLGITGETAKDTIDAIRKAVEKNIDPNTVKITSLVVDPGNGTNGKVILTVAAKATDSIAGYLLSPVYELPKSTDVTINIYRKDNLATDQWTFVKAVPKTITTTLEARVEVPIEGVDFNSGFYKVEIVQ